MGGGSEVRSNAEDSRSASDEQSFPIGVRRFDSCPPHHHLQCFCLCEFLYGKLGNGILGNFVVLNKQFLFQVVIIVAFVVMVVYSRLKR